MVITKNGYITKTICSLRPKLVYNITVEITIDDDIDQVRKIIIYRRGHLILLPNSAFGYSK